MHVLSTASEAHIHPDAASLPPAPRVIVDLRPVQFLDGSALGLLCRTHRRVGERHGLLRLVCVRPWHLRILRAAGLTGHFPLASDVTDALADRAPDRTPDLTACHQPPSRAEQATDR